MKLSFLISLSLYFPPFRCQNYLYNNLRYDSKICLQLKKICKAILRSYHHHRVRIGLWWELFVCIAAFNFVSTRLYIGRVQYRQMSLEINVSDNRRGNNVCTIQRNCQHWVHKTHDEDKQNKNTTQKTKKRNVGHHYAQIYTKSTIRHESSCKQLDARANQTSLLCGNRNGHNNTEQGHIKGEHKKLKRWATRTYQRSCE